MSPIEFSTRSLSTRITLFSLVIFVASIWALAIFANQQLRGDMQRQLGEQQLSTTGLVAAQVNSGLNIRLESLQAVAAIMPAQLFAQPAAMQTFLENRPSLSVLFNEGFYLTDLQGMVVASMPTSVVGRMGANYMDRNHIFNALRTGKSAVSTPAAGPLLQQLVVGLAVPVKDRQGRILGVIAGAIDLSKANFLDNVTGNHYGKTGGYLLEDPATRTIITGTDKSRAMQALPAAGVNWLIDRHVQGFEETGIVVNPLGVEVLASSSRIPAAGWFLVASLPTDEAFAAIHDLKWRIFLIALTLTVLAGLLTWWMLRRELLPLHNAAAELATFLDSAANLRRLPVARDDEVGILITSFNRLLDALQSREQALQRSELRFELAIGGAEEGIWDQDMRTGTLYHSPRMAQMLGYSEQELPARRDAWDPLTHPQDWQHWRDEMIRHFKNPEHDFDVLVRLRHKDGSWRWIKSRGKASRDSKGYAIRFTGTHSDVTEQHLARAHENFRSHILEMLTSRSALPDVLLAIVLGVEELHPDMLCSILLLDEEGRHLVNGVAPSLPDFYNAAINGVEIGDGVGSCGTAAWSGERVVAENLQTHPYWTDFKSLAASASLGACWSQPVKSADGKVLGTFAIYHRSPHTPSATDIALIEQSARLASIAIERKTAENRIHRMAFFDPLTQLPNRRLLSDRLQLAVAAGKRQASYGALMFLDLDNFKPLNDLHGHGVGDLLLIEVARRLNASVREVDTVARFGHSLGGPHRCGK